MLLLHPPLTKPCEPPAALAYLAGALQSHNIPCTLCDMNIEGLEYICSSSEPAEDTWSKRAFKNITRNLEALQKEQTYQNSDRYKRAVADVNRILELAGKKFNLQLSLSNYQDNEASPLNSKDLLKIAENFEYNIFYPYFKIRLEQLLQQSRSEYVGFSLNYLSQSLCTFAMIGYLKMHHPRVKVIVGGGLATTWLSHPGWANPFSHLIDHFIGGRGEVPLIKLLGHGAKNISTKLDYAPLRQNNYLAPGFILPYTSSYGCFWKKCNFCPETSEDSVYEHNHPATTVADLHSLCKKTKPALIHLLDNAISPSTLRALAGEKFTAPWYGFARFDNLLADKTFCSQLKESGCTMLKLGLESGDQLVLDQMNKGIDLHLASQVLTNLQEVGIKTYIYLLFGTPAEDRNAALRTMEFIEKHHQAVNFLNLAIFNLPIHSEQTATLEVSDFYEGDLSIYQNFIHPKGWNRGEIRRFLDQVFKKSPQIGPILLNDPPFFTSNHAPFLVTK